MENGDGGGTETDEEVGGRGGSEEKAADAIGDAEHAADKISAVATVAAAATVGLDHIVWDAF